MNYRLAKMLARKSFTADAVETIDINIKDPISQIVMAYEQVTVGTMALLGHPALCISKIEIIDGSDVLYSLSGVEAQAVDFYHNKREPANELRILNGVTCYQVFQLNFGRHLYDPLLALDPTKFTNPQMKITIDIDVTNIVNVQAYLTVMAHTFDEKVISPVGFLMHKEIKSWSLADATHEYTDLPTDFPYRKLLLRAQRYDYSPAVQIDNIKISEDNDKRIPLDNTSSEVLRAIISQTRPYRETYVTGGAAALLNNYITPCHRAHYGSAIWRTDANGGDIMFGFGDGGRLKIYVENTNRNIQLAGEGYLPHGVLEIPFGLQDEPDDWYDVTKVGSLKADITGGESTGTAELMLQQLRKY